jgi:hypothetical protein
MGVVHNTKDLTPQQFEELKKLCNLHCTLAEAASFFDMTDETLARNIADEYGGMLWSDFFKAYSGKGKVSLRRKQFQMAIDGDKTMLIWLGKQYLGQKEKVEHSGDGNAIPVQVIIPDNGRTNPTPGGASE